MEKTTKRKSAATGLVGVIALALAACVACCIPLIVPILAWLGISALGAAATGSYLGMAGVFALGVAAFLLFRHRRSSAAAAGAGSCCDGPSCKI